MTDKMSERPTQNEIRQQIKSAQEHVANWPEDVKNVMCVNNEANVSHAQDVEEQEVMKEQVSLLRKYSYEFGLTDCLETHELMMQAQKSVFDSVDKLRAKDAATIASLKAQLAETQNVKPGQVYEQAPYYLNPDFKMPQVTSAAQTYKKED